VGLLCPATSAAQSPADSDNEVRIGDQWVYNTKD
jgi:hypothetical protein